MIRFRRALSSPLVLAILLGGLVPVIVPSGSSAIAAGSGAPVSLTVDDAWIRAAPPGAAVLAAYATLRNSGAEAIEVTACPTAGIGEVSLHETVLEDGMSRMRPLRGASVPAHGTVVLEPGGMHLMLMDAAPQPQPDAMVDLCLAVDGIEGHFPFTVRRAAPGEDPHQHHGH